MTLTISADFKSVQRRLDALGRQMPFAASVALNRTAEWVATDERRAMRAQFDRPTPFFLNSLRVVRSTKAKLQAKVWFKDINSVDSASNFVLPHIVGGRRRFKQFEARLRAIGALPDGWFAVPAKGVPLNAYGNLSQGTISLVLNAAGAYTESGFNTIPRAQRKTKLAKQGRAIFVAGVGNPQGLPPGVFERRKTGFGSAIRAILIFVDSATYKKRFDFFGIGKRTAAQRFPQEADRAIALAIRTAKL